MANRIDALHKKSCELVEKRKLLNNQSDSLQFDFGIIEELVDELSDEDMVENISSHEKVLASEIKGTQDNLEENSSKIQEKAIEVDLYIKALEDNLSKLERIKGVLDLGKTSEFEKKTEKKIGELQEIKVLLEDEIDTVSICENLNDIAIVNQILDKPGIEKIDKAFQTSAYSFPILLQTNETWHKNKDGMEVYNTPNETGKKLDTNQGKVQGYLGTCGIVSCVNVLRIAGLDDVSEEQVLSIAKKKGLCNKFSESEYFKGATSAKNRMKILKSFGLQSKLQSCSINSIARSVGEGRGVIISVYAARLWWPEPIDPNATHAITVTSVKKNKYGDIVGFFVCDSGRHMESDCAKYYSADVLEFALTGRKMNVTKNIIR